MRLPRMALGQLPLNLASTWPLGYQTKLGEFFRSKNIVKSAAIGERADTGLPINQIMTDKDKTCGDNPIFRILGRISCSGQ